MSKNTSSVSGLNSTPRAYYSRVILWWTLIVRSLWREKDRRRKRRERLGTRNRDEAGRRDGKRRKADRAGGQRSAEGRTLERTGSGERERPQPAQQESRAPGAEQREPKARHTGAHVRPRGGEGAGGRSTLVSSPLLHTTMRGRSPDRLHGAAKVCLGCAKLRTRFAMTLAVALCRRNRTSQGSSLMDFPPRSRLLRALAVLMIVGGTAEVVLATSSSATRTSWVAYVATSASDTVTPINLATGTAGQQIAVGGDPDAIAFTPDGNTAYVANMTGHSVTPIRIATNSAARSIAVCRDPHAIAITPKGRTAYVVCYDSVIPINLATRTAKKPIDRGSNPFGIAITPNGTTAYVTDWSPSNAVTPINLHTRTSGTPIAVGDLPVGIAITPNGQTAYVANSGSRSVTPINLATNTPDTSIALPCSPSAIAITPDGQTAYVVCHNQVIPIHLATGGIAPPIAVPSVGSTPNDPNTIAITPDGKTVYVADSVASAIVPIDVATNTARSPIRFTILRRVDGRPTPVSASSSAIAITSAAPPALNVSLSSTASLARISPPPCTSLPITPATSRSNPPWDQRVRGQDSIPIPRAPATEHQCSTPPRTPPISALSSLVLVVHRPLPSATSSTSQRAGGRFPSGSDKLMAIASPTICRRLPKTPLSIPPTPSTFDTSSRLTPICFTMRTRRVRISRWLGIRAAGASDLNQGVDGADAVPAWMATPFHALAILNPLVETMGFADEEGNAALYVNGAIRDASDIGNFPVSVWPKVWPPNHSTVDLTSGRSELPSPAAACTTQWKRLAHYGLGLPVRYGLPVIVSYGPDAAPPSSAAATLSQGRTQFAVCVVTELNFHERGNLPNERYSLTADGRAILGERHSVFIIPARPLVPGQTYVVRLSSSDGSVSWSFTVPAHRG